MDNLQWHINKYGKLTHSNYAKIWTKLYEAYHNQTGIDCMAEAKKRNIAPIKYATKIQATGKLYEMAQAMFPIPTSYRKPRSVERPQQKRQTMQQSLFGNLNQSEAI